MNKAHISAALIENKRRHVVIYAAWLSSYRVANPERLPRRIVRLLFRVRRIEFDECRTEAAAIEREAALICVLQPRFNRAGQVWPESH